jgi:hypothetical protein
MAKADRGGDELRMMRRRQVLVVASPTDSTPLHG